LPINWQNFAKVGLQVSNSTLLLEQRIPEYGC